MIDILILFMLGVLALNVKQGFIMIDSRLEQIVELLKIQKDFDIMG